MLSLSLAHRASPPGGQDSGGAKSNGRRVRSSTLHATFRLFSLSLQGSGGGRRGRRRGEGDQEVWEVSQVELEE